MGTDIPLTSLAQLVHSSYFKKKSGSKANASRPVLCTSSLITMLPLLLVGKENVVFDHVLS